MKKSLIPLIPISTMLLLLSHPSLAFEGAKNGLLLWFNVVLPTLLPFMLCSSLIVSWGGVSILTRPFCPIFHLFRLSEVGSYVLMAGMLCGYPMGAKTNADFMRKGMLTEAEGKRLLAIAGFPSPMFLAGYIRTCLPKTIPFPIVAAALYLPIFLINPIARLFYKSSENAESFSGAKTLSASASEKKSFDELLMNCLEIMVKIGAYIMLFSILVLFANEFLPTCFIYKPLLLGFIEMTTGIKELSNLSDINMASVGILASASFGGLSGVFQTNTVIKNAGLSIRHYTLWKLLHAFLSSVFLILLLYR